MRTSELPRIQLVGELLVDGDWSLDAFGSLFGRLSSEVQHTGDMSRFIRFEGYTGGRCGLRFFGVEVDRIADVPEGMTGLDLGADRWAVTGSVNGQEVNWQEKLTWRWYEQSAPGRIIGDFSAECPAGWGDQPDSLYDFVVTAQAYFGRGKTCDDDVCLVDYAPSWPEQYKESADWLLETLGPEVALRVEHYGSTAIPDMPAKPVIDILVEVPSFELARESAIPLFSTPKVEYWWYSDHMVFIVREECMGRRTHHIHMAPKGHDVWEGLAFRDYLRSHKEEASRYAALKYKLAEDFRTDRERYTLAKEAFVREVIAKALSAGT
jgi:GrpB-like predicted nucleotidyltransferase (UPF0157 family)